MFLNWTIDGKTVQRSNKSLDMVIGIDMNGCVDAWIGRKCAKSGVHAFSKTTYGTPKCVCLFKTYESHNESAS